MNERWIEYDAPPYVLNETDISVNLTMYISLSWQTWFKVQLNNDTTFPIVYYDKYHMTTTTIIASCVCLVQIIHG